MRAFITFKTSEGYERCHKYLRAHLDDEKDKNPDFRKDIVLFGSTPEFVDACRPSNIIWENLQVNDWEMRIRRYFANFVITIFLLGTFFMFTYIKSYTAEFYLSYPVNTNCTSISNMFTGTDKKIEYKSQEYELFKEYAEDDKNNTISKHGAGYY